MDLTSISFFKDVAVNNILDHRIQIGDMKREILVSEGTYEGVVIGLSRLTSTKNSCIRILNFKVPQF
jgi:hypothetical protein